jgi:hypothetical protein
MRSDMSLLCKKLGLLLGTHYIATHTHTAINCLLGERIGTIFRASSKLSQRCEKKAFGPSKKKQEDRVLLIAFRRHIYGAKVCAV